MPSSKLFGESIAILQRAMDLRSTRHNVLASNIANMDTPNYKAFEVHVEEALQAHETDRGRLEMTRTHSSHLPLRPGLNGAASVQTAAAPDFTLRADGNTVDVDETMGRMAENTIKFKTAAQLISKKFKGLRTVIQGGK